MLVTSMTAKLDIKRELTALDLKNYNFYDNLTDEEKKAFAPYVLMRFASNVEADSETQTWFLERTNECLNKNLWDLTKNHKSLLWKLCAATGVGVSVRHPYIKTNSKEKTNKIEKLLAEIYPAMKISDIKFMAKMLTKNEKDALFDKLGLDESQRKKYE